MNRRDFLFKLGVASVAALAVHAIPFCPAKEAPKPHKWGTAMKVSPDMLEDKALMNDLYQEAMKGVPKGYECRSVEVGYDNDYFVKGLLTVVYSFYPS
jgi:hypothetical protein